jgi:hypothetical protein
MDKNKKTPYAKLKNCNCFDGYQRATEKTADDPFFTKMWLRKKIKKT